MLVLSRQPRERILLPDIGVTIQVLNVKGTTVRLGIEAPDGLTILREELEQRAAAKQQKQPSASHRLNNRLNKLGLSLQMLRRQCGMGLNKQAEAALAQALETVNDLAKEGLPGFLAPPKAPAAKKTRTLVVEDDSNERELLASLLRLEGCDVFTAADGNEALERLTSEGRPDLVLLDMWMPKCDGPQTIRRIRHEPSLQGLRVFAVSGTPPHDLGVTSGPDGVDAWFPKPLNAVRLLEAIRGELSSTTLQG